ncbi:MAG: SET domain-containing protein-lysine N-methyltransferase [Candidatus Falkowbacteria bacterium]
MQAIIIKKSKIQGKGVFAARDFKKGDIVIKWRPKKILTREQAEALPESDVPFECMCGSKKCRKKIGTK